jgi:hypothetical protein
MTNSLMDLSKYLETIRRLTDADPSIVAIGAQNTGKIDVT